MKKLLSILFLSLITTNNAYSLSEEKLIELTSKAYTPGAAGLIYDYCAHEDAFLEMLYSKSCKCAIKAGKAKNLAAVSLIVAQCGL